MMKTLILSSFVTFILGRVLDPVDWDKLRGAEKQEMAKPLIKSPQAMFHANDGDCIGNGQCYVGNDPANECCSGHVITNVLCVETAVCAMCQQAVQILKGAINGKSCAAIAPEGVAMCEIIGLGPEDPLADICAAIIVASCPKIMSLIADGISDDKVICTDIGMCSTNGSGMNFSQCDCVGKGHCTFWEAGCCSGKSDYSWSCLFPLSTCR